MITTGNIDIVVLEDQNKQQSTCPTTSYSIYKNYDLIQDDCITQHTLLTPGQEMEISSHIHSIKLFSNDENADNFESSSELHTSSSSSSIENSNEIAENLTSDENKKEIIKNVDHLFLLNNLLHPDECRRILQLDKNNHSEKTFESILSEYPEQYRNSKRIVFNDKELAQTLWRRMKKYLIRYSFVRPYGMDNGGCWKPVGVNECMRLSRYEKGNYFKPHVDGQFVRNSEERSVYTLLIYLNDEFSGGETRFLRVVQEENMSDSNNNSVVVKSKKMSRSDKKMSKKKFAKEATKLSHFKQVVATDQKESDSSSTLHFQHLCSIRPKTGSAAIFNHDSYHEGRPVTDSGIKYILRTEIMFKRVDSNSALKKKEEPNLYDHIMAILKQSDDCEKKGKTTESTKYYRSAQDLLILNGHSMALLMVPKFQNRGNFSHSSSLDSIDNELSILPDETLIHILSYLEDWEICTKILPLDRFFHHVGRHNHLWEELYMQRWGNSITELLKKQYNSKNCELSRLNRLDNTTSIDETPLERSNEMNHDGQDWYHIHVMKRYFEREFEPVFLDVGYDHSNFSSMGDGVEIATVKSLMYRPRFSHYSANSYSSYKLAGSNGNSRVKPFDGAELTTHFSTFILLLFGQLKKTPMRHPIVFSLSSVLMKKGKRIEDGINQKLFQHNVPAVCILPRCYLLSIHYGFSTCLVIDINQVCLSVHAIVENDKDRIESIYHGYPKVVGEEFDLESQVFSVAEQGSQINHVDEYSFDKCQLITMIDKILEQYSNEIRYQLSENIILSGEVMENKKQFLEFQKTIKTRFNSPSSRYKIKVVTEGQEAILGAKSFSKLPNFKDYFSYWFNCVDTKE